MEKKSSKIEKYSKNPTKKNCKKFKKILDTKIQNLKGKKAKNLRGSKKFNAIWWKKLKNGAKV